MRMLVATRYASSRSLLLFSATIFTCQSLAVVAAFSDEFLSSSDVLDGITRLLQQPGALRFIQGVQKDHTRPLVFDLGFNDGKDSIAFLEAGYRVVGVDANPLLIEQGLSKLAERVHEGQLMLVHAGLELEVDSNLTFWHNPQHSIWSSFERSKACRDPITWQSSEICEPIIVPLLRCEALWVFGTPQHLKVDIEERHYVCIQALKYLPQHMLPHFVSWEMHEMAQRKAYPLIDTRLLLDLYEVGYREVKMVLQGGEGAHSVGLTPNDAANHLTGDASWTSVNEALTSGVFNPRKLNGISGVWVDFYMRHKGGGSSIEEEQMHKRRRRKFVNRNSMYA